MENIHKDVSDYSKRKNCPMRISSIWFWKHFISSYNELEEYLFTKCLYKQKRLKKHIIFRLLKKFMLL